MTELNVETLRLPGSPIGPENPLPFFRDKAVDRTVNLDASMPDEKRRYFGWQAGQRVLPYRMQDQYDRRQTDYTMKVAVLENESLKATFWLELGGRLMSLIYKPEQRELLYNNSVFQPANLALRNAWFAGGIEWNVGHYGHSYLTCSPVFAAAIKDENGEPGLRLYEFERCKGFLWQTDFTLPARSEFLIAYTRVINPQDEDSSMYWWTNMAVPEAPGVRVLASADQAIYIDRARSGFGFSSLPDLPSLPGMDPTYSLNWPSANEFFFQCDQADIPWEAALDAQGKGLIEASTPRLKYRKLFCWGTHHGGRHWQDFLAVPGRAYLEIQAGLAPTQLHHLPFGARQAWDWTEFFGYFQADPNQVHDPNYGAAWRALDAALKRRVSASELQGIEDQCRSRVDQPSTELLQMGSGWGALEMARRERQGSQADIPNAFYFPASSMNHEQTRWLPILSGGTLADQPPDQIPGEWLVQRPWREMLSKSLAKPENQNWYAWLHYGVMLAEALDDAGAQAAWQASIAIQPSAWAYRNLAVLQQANGKLSAALEDYARAWMLALGQHQLPLEPMAYEYLALFIQASQFQPAWEFISRLPDKTVDSDRIQILQAVIALKLNHLAVVEEVLRRDFATVREGQLDLSNLWLELWRARTAQETGQALEQVSMREVAAAHPVPPAIDFRSAEDL